MILGEMMRNYVLRGGVYAIKVYQTGVAQALDNMDQLY
jgi:hypothetical protein